MSQNASQIRAFAGGAIAIAPVGTALPATEAATLDPAFVEIGFVTSDGVTLTFGVETENVESWQSPQPTRKLVTNRPVGAAFQAQQWNRANVSLAFGGGLWASTGTGWKFTPPASSDGLAEYAVVFTAQDGSHTSRYSIKRAVVESEVETQFVRNAASVLPITLSVLAPSDGSEAFEYLSNDIAFS